jgi:hypothetical protein
MAFVALVSFLVVWISVCQAQPLTWITSQTEALALAQIQAAMLCFSMIAAGGKARVFQGRRCN